MNNPAISDDPNHLPRSIISKINGSQQHLLPGESAEEYCIGLSATMEELGAKTPLQVYLAEKIFDCVWWIRRHEAQKQVILINGIWRMLEQHFPSASDTALLESGDWTAPKVVKALKAIGHSHQSLIATVITKENNLINLQDCRIGERIKALRGLQACYESLANRKLVIDRLHLQNEGMRLATGSSTGKVLARGQ